MIDQQEGLCSFFFYLAWTDGLELKLELECYVCAFTRNGNIRIEDIAVGTNTMVVQQQSLQ